MHYKHDVHFTEAGGDVFLASKLTARLASLSAEVKRFYSCYVLCRVGRLLKWVLT
jgi:hypothetical protein